MRARLTAKVVGGQLVPDAPLDLPEGAEVWVLVPENDRDRQELRADDEPPPEPPTP